MNPPLDAYTLASTPIMTSMQHALPMEVIQIVRGLVLLPCLNLTCTLQQGMAPSLRVLRIILKHPSFRNFRCL